MNTHCPHGEHIGNHCPLCEAQAHKPTPASEFVARDEHDAEVKQLSHQWTSASEKLLKATDALTAATQRADSEEAHAQEWEVTATKLLERAEKAEGERDAMSAILILADGYCLACGGTGGHSEGCQGTTGMVALAKQNEILRADLAAIQQEEARRIRHLNRIGTWAQQDPTGPLCHGGIQAWVLAELKGALGAAYEPTAWQPETVSQERLMAVTTSGDEATPEVAELIAHLRSDKEAMEQDISNLLAANDESDHVIQQLRADLEATKADSERRRVDILRWVKRSDEAHKACAEMRTLLQSWAKVGRELSERGGISYNLITNTEQALSTDCIKGWVSPEAH